MEQVLLFTTPIITVSTPYYVEASNNGCSSARTLVDATINDIPSVTSTTPASRCGSGTVNLIAATSAGSLNWYTAATGGSPVGTGTSFTTPIITVSTPYYVEASNNGCSSARTLVDATINDIPLVTSTTPASRCGSGTVNLIAATSAGSLNWYTAATGGSPVGTGTSFTTPIITVSTPYYVEASNNGCSSARTLVDATINDIPSVTSTTPASRCGSGTVNLIAATSAGSLNWYTAATGGSPVGTGTSFTTPIITVSTPYYVEASNNGCSSARTLVDATINDIPSVTSTTPASRCGSGTVNLIAATSAGSLNWYTAATGGSPVGTGTSFTTPIITVSTPYYVEASNNGCSSARTLVDATINDIPLVTSTTPASRCGSGTVNLIAATSAGSRNWYTAVTGGSPVGTGTSFYNTNNYCLYSLLC
ncbi:MAG: hypothetical protein IPN99_03075 [Bacteroidetes bacterium]|nr:hypothetical protein [Bacteroidota bacterium]